MHAKRSGIDVNKFNKLLEELDRTKAETGWFSASKYEDGTSVAYVASIQEFGAPDRGIPPRLGMRETIKVKSKDWKRLIEAEIKKLIKGQNTPYAVMERIALQAEKDFQKKITQVWEPPLSMVTLLLRKIKKRDKKNQIKIGGRVVGETYAALQGQYDGTRVGPPAWYHKMLGKVSTTVKNAGPPDISGVSTKPLIDSGLLLASLTHVVRQS